MPDLTVLDSIHEEHAARSKAWTRDERRLYGDDAVCPAELTKWAGEDGGHYDARAREAPYLPLPQIHAGIIAGHIERVRQSLSFGDLGPVRPRDKRDGDANLAELIYYNVDGVGSDGSEWPAWWGGVQQRACATGHRWIMIEAPELPGDRKPSLQDVQQRGARPYAVEYSPLSVTSWEEDKGQLQYAVIRVRTSRSRVVDGGWKPAQTKPGYYLLVRAGFDGLGAEFSGGGWWLYDENKNPVTDANGKARTGTWANTRGEIPLFKLIGDDSQGTTEYAASSHSLTTPLGQIAVSLMNRVSERCFDASDAAKSTKWVSGVEGSEEGAKKWNFTSTFLANGAMAVPLPFTVVVTDDKGGRTVVVPTIYDSSSGAVAGEVFDSLTASLLTLAKEIMLRQVTEPQASGKSRELAHAGAVSPLLGTLAARRQAAENIAIYFFELRGGKKPKGAATFKREVPLQPVTDDIDHLLKTMQSAGLKSPTLAAHLVSKQADEFGLKPDELATQIDAELKESAALPTAEETDNALINAALGSGGPRPRTRGAPNENGNNDRSGERRAQGNGASGDGVGANDETSRETERTSDEGGEGAGTEAIRAQLEAVQSSVTSLATAVQALAEKVTGQPAPIVPPITLIMPQENGTAKTKRIEIAKTESGYSATVTASDPPAP